jgi:hypothetical protein
VPFERGENGIDVLLDLVGVRRDAQVAVALGGDDGVLCERVLRRDRVRICETRQ